MKTIVYTRIGSLTKPGLGGIGVTRNRIPITIEDIHVDMSTTMKGIIGSHTGIIRSDSSLASIHLRIYSICGDLDVKLDLP